MVVTPILDSPKLAKITNGITERENENDQKASQWFGNHRRAYRVIEFRPRPNDRQSSSIRFGRRHGGHVAGGGGNDTTGGRIGSTMWNVL